MRENEFENDKPFDHYRRGFKSHWSINRNGFISHPYFRRRWGLVQGLPTSFDNAESIYELIAWLQKMMKRLLDDFVALEAEFDEFKNAMIDLLEKLIPELIRQFAKSEEFKNIIKDMLKSDEFQDLLEEILRSPRFYNLFKEILKQALKDDDVKDALKETIKEILKDPDMKEYFKNYFKEIVKSLEDDPDWQKIIKDLLNKILKDTDAFKDLQEALTALSGQPPLNKPKTIYVSPNLESTNNELKYVGIETASQVIGNRRYIWYRPTLSFYRTTRTINAGDELASVTFNQLKDAGLHQELIDGITINHAVFLGVLDNGSNAVLELSKKEGYDEMKISTRFTLPQGASLLVQPEPRLYIMKV